VLLADYKGYQRLARLKYVPLAGGDISVLRPYRMALSHLWAAGLAWDEDLPPVQACPGEERRILLQQLQTGLGCAPTSSMGRLFDAVSSLVGVRHLVAYEAQAAIELEGLSRNADHHGARYAFTVDASRLPAMVDPGPVLAAIIDDSRAGTPANVIGAKFHCAVADLVVALAGMEDTGSQPVALSGGVFQNALLLRLVLDGLRTNGFRAITHRHVPPNDGGIALGQLLVGTAG
jgi:hydrogenase maturation protein HypF